MKFIKFLLKLSLVIIFVLLAKSYVEHNYPDLPIAQVIKNIENIIKDNLTKLTNDPDYINAKKFLEALLQKVTGGK